LDGANSSLASAAWPLAARAQQGNRVRRIGVLFPGDENDPAARGHQPDTAESGHPDPWPLPAGPVPGPSSGSWDRRLRRANLPR